jgi:hypothetical protein
MPGPDFSLVKSRQQAEELARRGELEPLLLLPAEFGGKAIPENVVYVPTGIRAAKELLDRTVIAPLVAGGRLTRYSAVPEYQGESFIPIAIRIETDAPAAASIAVNVWGEALNRDPENAG